jgi:hypothetical protein
MTLSLQNRPFQLYSLDHMSEPQKGSQYGWQGWQAEGWRDVTILRPGESVKVPPFFLLDTHDLC